MQNRPLFYPSEFYLHRKISLRPIKISLIRESNGVDRAYAYTGHVLTHSTNEGVLKEASHEISARTLSQGKFLTFHPTKGLDWSLTQKIL